MIVFMVIPKPVSYSGQNIFNDEINLNGFPYLGSISLGELIQYQRVQDLRQFLSITTYL